MLILKKLSYLFIAIIGLLLILNACGRKGELNINLLPIITITSYEGVEDPDQIGDSILFQQKIYWDAYDPDGTVTSYAFRVVDSLGVPYKDENGAPTGTPGYEYVDDQGWVYHYQPGADETIPMDDPAANISIWTTQVYAEINFPANGEQLFDNGEPVIDDFGNPVYAPLTSIFEIKCIDNDEDESEIVRKYFYSFSAAPSVVIESTQGDISQRTIGTGIYFQFRIRDNDQYVGEISYYFLFKLEKRDLDGNIIPYANGGYDTTWISTKGQTDVTRYLMTQKTDPALIPNFSQDDPVINDSTYIIAKGVDIAGIVSDPDTVSFLIYDGYHPGTLIYQGNDSGDGCDIWILGENHFTKYLDGQITKVIEEENTSDGTHFSTPFWINKEGEFAVLGSSDLKIFAHWGWHGEYGQTTQGEPNITDNPFDLVVGTLKDEDTDATYYSEMQYFDLRLDGEPYYYPPLPPEGDNLQIDDNGKEWLRIPIHHSIAQHSVLTSLEEGLHRLEVRAVDLQDAGDPTPASMIFRIVNRVPKDEKEGILIIDDSQDNNNFAPEALLDSLYFEEFLAGYSGTIDMIDREELKETVWRNQLHFARDVFSPTDLERYKWVIYHSDQITVDSNFQKEFEIFSLYLRGGGNLIMSGGLNFRNTLNTLEDYLIDDNVFLNFFGLSTEDGDVIKAISKNGSEAIGFTPDKLALAYFNKATADNGFSQDIDLQIPSFNPFVNYSPVVQDSVKGLGPIAIFEESLLPADVEVIYRFGCKEPGDGPLDPTFDEYEEFTGQPVAIRRVTEDNSCYIFGFPLSYMKPEQVNVMMLEIINGN